MTTTVKSVALSALQRLRLWPQNPTYRRVALSDAKGQKATFCAAAIGVLFDNLVGDGEKRGRNCKAQSLCGLEVDDQLKFCRCLHMLSIPENMGSAGLCAATEKGTSARPASSSQTTLLFGGITVVWPLAVYAHRRRRRNTSSSDVPGLGADRVKKLMSGQRRRDVSTISMPTEQAVVARLSEPPRGLLDCFGAPQLRNVAVRERRRR